VEEVVYDLSIRGLKPVEGEWKKPEQLMLMYSTAMIQCQSAWHGYVRCGHRVIFISNYHYGHSQHEVNMLFFFLFFFSNESNIQWKSGNTFLVCICSKIIWLHIQCKYFFVWNHVLVLSKFLFFFFIIFLLNFWRSYVLILCWDHLFNVLKPLLQKFLISTP
jgi:hypothetical protein